MDNTVPNSIKTILSKNKEKDIVLPISSGLDSSVAAMMLFQAAEKGIIGYERIKLYRVNLDYDKKVCFSEKKALLAQMKIWRKLHNGFPKSLKVRVVRIKGLVKLEKSFVPYRNLWIVSAIASVAKNDSLILLSGIKGDNVSDNNTEAYELMNKVIEKFGKPKISAKVQSLVSSFTKGELLGWVIKVYGKSLGVKLFRNMFSCYAPVVKNNIVEHCCKCEACFRRFVAAKVNGIDIGFSNKELVNKYISNLKNYHIARQREIRKALEL